MRHLIRYYTLEIYFGIYLLIAINVGSSIYGQNGYCEIHLSEKIE